ncbi:Exosome complex exonuclease RRP46 -like protein [Capsicum annuum]|nr:Exosome complex exonuclease RRP46 -like protein [Capsicum annuum]
MVTYHECRHLGAGFCLRLMTFVIGRHKCSKLPRMSSLRSGFLPKADDLRDRASQVWKDRIRNELILDKVGVTSLEVKMREARNFLNCIFPKLLPCAINALCAALVDAGIPLKHLAVAICCCLADSGHILLDPSKLEEQMMKAFVYLIFPNSTLSVLPEEPLKVRGEPMEHGLIASSTHGVMSVDDYIRCLERGRAATAKLSDFLRRSLQSQVQSDTSKLG